jgi:TetR/AcrR family transcriptional regulator, transcriptional repressor for nem operon
MISMVEGQKQGIDPSLHLSETADFILSSWEGALLRMKAESNTSPLILVEQMVFGRVLKQQISTRSKSTQMRHR